MALNHVTPDVWQEINKYIHEVVEAITPHRYAYYSISNDNLALAVYHHLYVLILFMEHIPEDDSFWGSYQPRARWVNKYIDDNDNNPPFHQELELYIQLCDLIETKIYLKDHPDTDHFRSYGLKRMQVIRTYLGLEFGLMQNP